MATTTTLGKVSLTMGGNYSPTATYDRLTVVRGVNGNSYVTLMDGVSGISPGVTSGWQTYWQLFAEDGSGGGGGSTVVVTPIVTTGTKIATITVDGTDSDLYAPEGGSGTVTDVQVNGTSIVTSGVANIPYASTSAPGLVYPGTYGTNGLSVNNSTGLLTTSPANDSNIKAGNVNYKPIVSSTQHQSVFFGLSKAAGVDLKDATVTVGTYPDNAKAAIQAMIGAGVEVVRLA